jgi:RNA polymerase sigma factor (sigma-70 family)
MKKFNVPNYVKYKEDVQQSIDRVVDNHQDEEPNQEWSRDELIIYFLPLVEEIARRFSTSDQASGVMDITDLIQDGSIGLISAVDRIDWETVNISTDRLTTLKSFLSKRIKGAIRRAIDINRGDIRIPEHKLNEIRRTEDENDKIVQMFFNSIFLSIDSYDKDDNNIMYEVEDKSEAYNIGLMNVYLLTLMKTHLNDKEYDVLRMSYGLDCEKYSAKEIADKLNIEGTASYVRVSQIKREAIDKLIANVHPDQVIDFL